VLLLLPHWARPVVISVLLVLWAVLEVGHRALLGDIGWLPAHPGVPIEPQARAAALVLHLGSPHEPGQGLSRWVVPIWRFVPGERRAGPMDALDLAFSMRGAACLRPRDGEQGMREPRLLGTLREMSRSLWIARHWSADEMIGVWAHCMTVQLAECGERIDPPWSASDVVHLWAHWYGGRVCDGRHVKPRFDRAASSVRSALPGESLNALTLPGLCSGRLAPGARDSPR